MMFSPRIWLLWCHVRFVYTQSLPQTNFILIMFDDLRPELKVYGREHMITPNFDRLAAKSVIFDHAYCQVAVCNPSRDSLLTGLRPDSTGTHQFQSSFEPHLVMPSRFVAAGYNTAGIGKTFHWENNWPRYWNFDAWDGDWYKYQLKEYHFMNSSVMADKLLPENQFKDYIYATRAINTLKRMAKESKYFMLSVGFKNPHLAMHVPSRYYDMYKNKTDAWRLTKKELRYPTSSCSGGYRCCSETSFRYMNGEGSLRYNETYNLGNVNKPTPRRMHNELMIAYCGMITYVDEQLGRLLDTIDELQLWNNLTVVLTADHGMHNGEKGIWEKWSLFDESARVPLMIYHPKSPFKGQHYTKPVELVDVFPTVNDLTQAPYDDSKPCKQDTLCKPLEGKSLAHAVLGDVWVKHFESNFDRDFRKNSRKNKLLFVNDVQLIRDFSITQVYRCVMAEAYKRSRKQAKLSKMRDHIWKECERTKPKKGQIATMGYSMRTNEFRYTAWLRVNRTNVQPYWDLPPLEEDLFDHRNETLADFTHRETVNVARKADFQDIVIVLRQKLLHFLKTEVVYRGPF